MTILAAVWEDISAYAGKFPANPNAKIIRYEPSFAYCDRNFVRHSFWIQTNECELSIDLEDDYSDIWLHFEMRTLGGPYETTRGWIEFCDAAGVIQYRIAFSGSSNQHYLQRSIDNGVSFINVDGSDTFTFDTNYLNAVDIHIKADDIAGEAAVYVNAALSNVNVTGGNVSSSSNSIRYVVVRTESTSSRFYFSQIIVSTTNTVGWKVQSVTAVSNSGALTEWDGNHNDVNEPNLGGLQVNGLATNVPGEIHTFPTTDVTSYASGLVVQGVILAVTGYITPAASVDDIRGILRIGSTNYETPDLEFVAGDGVQYRTHLWGEDPSTLGVFTESQINNLQIGVLATS